LAFLGVTQVRAYRRGFRALRLPPQLRPLHPFNRATSSVFVATARIGMRSSGLPAQVTVDPTWLWLQGVWVERSLVTGIYTWRSIFATGFMFDSTDGRYDGVILWTLRPSRVTAALARHGWPTPIRG
jgi:hypothetical protein